MLFLSWLLLPISAQASAYCYTPAELNPRVQNCLQNAYYAEAGVLCVNAFKTKVDAASQAAGQAMKAGVAASQNNQSKNFNTTGKSYALSQDTLKSLIAEGTARQAEVDSYRDQVVFPDEVMEGAGNNLAKRLSTSHCYEDNQIALRAVNLDFDRKLADLKKAQLAAAGLQNTSNAAEGNLNGSLSETPVNSGVSAPGPVSNIPYSGSDISGTEDPKNK